MSNSDINNITLHYNQNEQNFLLLTESPNNAATQTSVLGDESSLKFQNVCMLECFFLYLSSFQDLLLINLYFLITNNIKKNMLWIDF